MAAVNHTNVIDALEKAEQGSRAQLCWSLLEAHGTLPATVSLRKIGDRNLAKAAGDVGVALKLYFRVILQGNSSHETVNDDIWKTGRIGKETKDSPFVFAADFQSTSVRRMPGLAAVREISAQDRGVERKRNGRCRAYIRRTFSHNGNTNSEKSLFELAL